MNWIEVEKPDFQIDHGKWVICVAEIRDNATGEIREYESEEVLEDGEDHPSVFNWEDNNYACDCNRLLFFKRVKGEETDEDFDNTQCSTGKYSVNLKNKKDGKIYYREFD